MNRRIPNGTYGGVRGRGLVTPSYSIVRMDYALLAENTIEEESREKLARSSIIIDVSSIIVDSALPIPYSKDWVSNHIS